MLSCQAKASCTTRESALQELLDHLKNAHAPQPILDALAHGIHDWTQFTDPSRIGALRFGIGNVLLTLAFTEQYHSTSWMHLLLSRVSHKREKVCMHYCDPSTTPTYSALW
jgi:hypothetical protein